MKRLLSVAGFDPTGGAGILRDIKIFQDLGFEGAGVVSSLTVQSTERVFAAIPLNASYVQEALNHLNLKIDGMKTGMLYTEDVVVEVYKFIKRHSIYPVVVDPVIFSSSGFKLIEDAGIMEMVGHLFSVATFITPNYTEGKYLTGETDPEKIVRSLKSRGPEYIILKMGEEGGRDLFYDGKDIVELRGERLKANLHGSGCTHSSALLCYLSMGLKPLDAAKKAKKYTEDRIKGGD